MTGQQRIQNTDSEDIGLEIPADFAKTPQQSKLSHKSGYKPRKKLEQRCRTIPKT